MTKVVDCRSVTGGEFLLLSPGSAGAGDLLIDGVDYGSLRYSIATIASGDTESFTYRFDSGPFAINWSTEGIQAAISNRDADDPVGRNYFVTNLTTGTTQPLWQSARGEEPDWTQSYAWWWSRNGRTIMFRTWQCLERGEGDLWHGYPCIEHQYRLRARVLTTSRSYVVAEHSGAFWSWGLSDDGHEVAYSVRSNGEVGIYLDTIP